MHPARDQPAGRAGDLPAWRTPGLRRRADLGPALLRRAARGGVPGSTSDRPALTLWDAPERSTLGGWRTLGARRSTSASAPSARKIGRASCRGRGEMAEEAG